MDGARELSGRALGFYLQLQAPFPLSVVGFFAAEIRSARRRRRIGAF